WLLSGLLLLSTDSLSRLDFLPIAGVPSRLIGVYLLPPFINVLLKSRRSAGWAERDSRSVRELRPVIRPVLAKPVPKRCTRGAHGMPSIFWLRRFTALP